jgi:hypothetical protein
MLNSKTRTRIYQILLSEPSLSLDEIRTSLAKQGLPINKLMLNRFCSEFNSTVRFLRSRGLLWTRPLGNVIVRGIFTASD